MKHYNDCMEFYHGFVKEYTRHATIDNIDSLAERLRSEGYIVKELKDNRYSVRSPEEITASDTKRKARQALGAAQFTKIGAALPKGLVSQFAKACRQLGSTQAAILMPVVINTIEKAKLLE